MGRSSNFILIFIASCVFRQFKSCDANNITEPKGAHTCDRVIKFKTHETVSYSTPTLEYYSYCCERFILCMKYCQSTRYKTVVKTKLVTKSHKKITKYCCKGWVQYAKECIPTCNPACIHGKCIRPNFCACREGYSGNQCQIAMTEKETSDKKNENTNHQTKKSSSISSSWSWILPTILFATFIIAIFIYFKVKRRSIYEGSIMVDQSDVRYSSFENDGRPLTVL